LKNLLKNKITLPMPEEYTKEKLWKLY